jgi:hypothetical protein
MCVAIQPPAVESTTGRNVSASRISCSRRSAPCVLLLHAQQLLELVDAGRLLEVIPGRALPPMKAGDARDQPAVELQVADELASRALEGRP